MRLIELIEEEKGTNEDAVDITGLTSNSREVKPGYLFAALPGNNVKGTDYIPEALSRGAKAILVPSSSRIDTSNFNSSVLIKDNNPRQRLAKLAARFYKRQPSYIAAITGTNGKTSTAVFLRELWLECGVNAGSLGTLGEESDGNSIKTKLTTPDPITLHQSLDRQAGHNVTHCVIEASSHGLDQYRLDGVSVSAGAFLNLTRDHLDYHINMDAYLKSKARLFNEVMEPNQDVVLNGDSPYVSAISKICHKSNHREILFGCGEGDIRLIERNIEGFNQNIKLELLGKNYNLNIAFPGALQIYNLMAAAGLAIVSGMKTDDIAEGMTKLTCARGRMDLVARLNNGASIFIDYAHTPDALSTVLKDLRNLTNNNLVVVFGCGGNRDAGKRPEMGRIASDLADIVFITDDNPRLECPESIRREIISACPNSREIGMRKNAICEAIRALKENDILLIAGKGHEQGQNIGGKVIPFDDRKVALDQVAFMNKSTIISST